MWSVAMLAYSIAAGVRHDYHAYLAQWQLVLAGQNPWSGSNTYGPLHNVLAYLTVVNPLVPKVAVGVAFCAVNGMLALLLLRRDPGRMALVAYVVIVPFNALVVGIAFSFGLNDTLAASLIGLAVIARFRDRLVWCGILLGLAVLLKYYPALIVPLFCLDRRRLDPRPLLAAVGVTMAGLLGAWITWGSGFLAALADGATRRPQLLSVLSSLQRKELLGADSDLLDWLIRFNWAFVLTACAAALIAAWALDFSWIEGSALAALAVLVVYKVGHQQFYLPWMFLLVGLLILGTPRALALAYASLPYVVFLSAFQVGYELLTDAYREVGGFVRDDVGLVAFALGAVTIAAYVVIGMRHRSAVRPRMLSRAAHG